MALANPSNLERGISFYDRQQYKQSNEELIAATRLAPTSSAAHYYLANTLVRLGQHPLAQQHYQLAYVLDPSGNYGAFAKIALDAYEQKTGSASLPQSRFAVARIVGSGESSANQSQLNYPIPRQYPQIAGYDADRSYLYQHGIFQAYGGPINTQLPSHTKGRVDRNPAIANAHFSYDDHRTPYQANSSLDYGGYPPSSSPVLHGAEYHDNAHHMERHHDRHH